MGLLDKVAAAKQRTEEHLSRGGGRTGARFWKPEAGENRIRIMPQWDAGLDGQFWREVAQHWNVSEDQKGPVLCPKETPDLEGDCPICELVQVLRADKSNVEAQRLAKDLRAKKTYLLNVVVEKDPVYTAQDVAEYKQERPQDDPPFSVGDPKIQIYACPVTLMDTIFGIIHSSGSDITDHQDGRAIKINKIPHKDRLKTRYEIYPDLKTSASGVSEDFELPKLDKVGYTMDYDGLVGLLEGGRAADFAGSFLPSGASHSLPAASDGSAEEELEGADDLAEQMRQHLTS